MTHLGLHEGRFQMTNVGLCLGRPALQDCAHDESPRAGSGRHPGLEPCPQSRDLFLFLPVAAGSRLRCGLRVPNRTHRKSTGTRTRFGGLRMVHAYVESAYNPRFENAVIVMHAQAMYDVAIVYVFTQM